MQEQPRNNTKITYYSRVKTTGNAVFPLIIVDILVSQWAKKTPITITEIQAELEARGITAGRSTITGTMANIHNALVCPSWEIFSTIVRRGRTKTHAFYIKFITEI